MTNVQQNQNNSQKDRFANQSGKQNYQDDNSGDRYTQNKDDAQDQKRKSGMENEACGTKNQDPRREQDLPRASGEKR